MARRSSKLALGFKLVIATGAIALPLFGAWLSSSLAAYANGPRWLLVPTALLGFPLLPLGWDLLASARRTRQQKARLRILSFSDRLWLRTLALNVVFVAALFALGPRAAMRALSTRGDWFLDGTQAAWAVPVRNGLHTIAGGLDALYRTSHHNPYQDGAEPHAPDPTPAPLPRGDEIHDVAPVESATPPAPAPPPPTPPPPPPLDATHAWPRPAELHPAVLSIQPSDEITIESVASYMVLHEPSKLGQVKALHDWVADRISYDVAALTGVRPPQTAAATFARRSAVCAGYAELLAALGKAAHLQIEYVIGDARGANGEVDGAGHAWNVATVDGASYLLDATWDSGFVEGSPLHYTKKFATDYLFTPPNVFGIAHFPQHAHDQLRTPPLSRGDFMREPQLDPRFFALGFTLLSPTRSQVTVQGGLDIELAMPDHFVLASFEPKGGGPSTRCTVAPVTSPEVTGPTVRVHCDFPGRGEYRVQLFENAQRYGTYDSIGELQVQDSR